MWKNRDRTRFIKSKANADIGFKGMAVFVLNQNTLQTLFSKLINLGKYLGVL